MNDFHVAIGYWLAYLLFRPVLDPFPLLRFLAIVASRQLSMPHYSVGPEITPHRKTGARPCLCTALCTAAMCGSFEKFIKNMSNIECETRANEEKNGHFSTFYHGLAIVMR